MILGLAIVDLYAGKIAKSHNLEKKYEILVERIITSNGWVSLNSDRLTLSEDDIEYYIIVKKPVAYFILISGGFPRSKLFPTYVSGSETIFDELISYVEKFDITATNWNHKSHTIKFNDIIKRYSQYCNTKINKIKNQLDEVKITMIDNIDSQINSSNKTNNLQDKAMILNNEVSKFNKNTEQLKRNLCSSNLKTTLGIILITLMVMGIIIAFAILI